MNPLAQLRAAQMAAAATSTPATAAAAASSSVTATPAATLSGTNPFAAVSHARMAGAAAADASREKVAKLFGEIVSTILQPNVLQKIKDNGFLQVNVLFQRGGVTQAESRKEQVEITYPENMRITSSELEALADRFRETANPCTVITHDYAKEQRLLEREPKALILRAGILNATLTYAKATWTEVGMTIQDPEGFARVAHQGATSAVGQAFEAAEKEFVNYSGNQARIESTVADIFKQDEGLRYNNFSDVLGKIQQGHNVEYRLLFNDPPCGEDTPPAEIHAGHYTPVVKKLSGTFSLAEIAGVVNQIVPMCMQAGYTHVGEFRRPPGWKDRNRMYVCKEASDQKQGTQAKAVLSILIPANVGTALPIKTADEMNPKAPGPTVRL